MASTLNADNGVVSGSAGLKSSADSTGVLALQTNGTTAVTIDASQNVGIGTATPTGKLEISGAAAPSLFITDTRTPTQVQLQTQNGFGWLATVTNHSLGFATNNTERMRLDTSGNLGLGVTPSAWSATRKAIQFGVGGSFNGSTSTYNFADYGANFYNNGTNELYLGSDYATKYRQISGQHQWYTAASGTAGNTITFTQAMTLDASGNLGIGTTSPGAKLDLGAPNVINTTNTFRISNPYYNYWDITNTVGGNLSFSRGSSEFARIDSSGNLLVGTTSVSTWGGKVSIQQDSSTSFYPLSINNTAAGSTSYVIVDFYRSASRTGYISNTNTATAYNTSSDYRLKEDVAPMTGALAKVAALKPVTYKWKVDGSDGEGFIAHELQAVCPQAVHGEKDAVNADGNPVYQGIDTSFLVATLTAAIQEQQQIITTLTQRVEALEGAK